MFPIFTAKHKEIGDLRLLHGIALIWNIVLNSQ